MNDAELRTSSRIYHRGALINSRGGVSALCFTTPRAIDLKRATWTNRDEAVTCAKCRRILAERAAPGTADGGA